MIVEIMPYYYRVVSRNGQVLLHSETYSNRWNARRAAKRFARALERGVVVRDCQ